MARRPFLVSDWAAHEIIAVDLEGKSEVVVREPSIPLCFDFLPDGRLVIMSGRRILRLELDGSRATHADLTGLSEFGWNDIVVDGRANAYVNAAGFDLMAGADFVPGTIAVVTADGSVRQVADGIAFPNGMAVTPDNSTLIVAESYGRKLSLRHRGRRWPFEPASVGRPRRRRSRWYLPRCGERRLVR